MKLAEVKDWIKSNTSYGDGIAVGNINGDKDRYIGVYQGKNVPVAREAVGGATGYRMHAVSVLVHWGQNATAAEAKADELYQLIRAIDQEQMGNTLVLWARMQKSDPVFVGRDARGNCEYVIEFYLCEGVN